MVISDHHLAVLSFAAFCRFLDGIAGTDKVDETLEEFMEWSGFAVSLEEVREKASQPLAEEERAVLLACWRKFLDLGVPVDEQTVGTAAGAEAPGKEVSCIGRLARRTCAGSYARAHSRAFVSCARKSSNTRCKCT